MSKPRVVVVGGGFGGLEALKLLAGHELELTLVDKENFFQFNPLLPEVATGAVETRHIVYPLRKFCAPRNIRFVRNKVRAVDHERRELHLHNDLVLPYDKLILAAGSTTNFFGVPGAEEHAFPFKTLMDAIRLRAHVVEMWELADQAQSPEVRRRLLTFVVAGGGITGVEVCASLTAMFRRTMCRLYPGVSPSLVTVHLVEAGERLLGGISETHSEVAARHLRVDGVQVVLNRKVTAVEAGRIHLDDGSVIPAHTLIWTTGVRGQDLPLPWDKGRGGRLKVDAACRVAEGVYAVGDAADCVDVEGRPLPMVAQGAMQAGRVAAQNVLAELDLARPTQIKYFDIGYIVGLGRHSTVASVMGIPVAGWIAWYVWAFAYMLKMVGLRKQIEVATDMLKSVIVDHDTSQIHERRRMLRPQDLDPHLGEARTEAR